MKLPFSRAVVTGVAGVAALGIGLGAAYLDTAKDHILRTPFKESALGKVFQFGEGYVAFWDSFLRVAKERGEISGSPEIYKPKEGPQQIGPR